MNYHEFLRRLPKVELHYHLEGSVRASTLVELANKNGLKLPAYEEAEDLYHSSGYVGFFEMYNLAAHSMRDQEDFRRTTYEFLEDGAATGLRYREMFWSPQVHMEDGVSYQVMIEGIIQGIRDAVKDFGVQCRIIADIPRYTSRESGVDLVQSMIDNPRDEVIGLGSDYEYSGKAQKHAEAYTMAKRAGFKLCAHAGQVEGPDNIAYFIDKLGIDRVDHGYSVLQDYDFTRRCADEGIHFTVTPQTQLSYHNWNFSLHPIREMINRGITISINSDDPSIRNHDLALDYILIADYMGYGPEDFKRFVLDSISGSWLDDDTKKDMTREWSSEIDSLIGQIEEPPGLEYRIDRENNTWSVIAETQLIHR